MNALSQSINPNNPGLFVMNQIFPRLALAAVLACAVPVATAASAFPDKPVKLVIPFPPGGLISAISHAMTTKMAQRLGQPVVSEPRPGAGGSIAATAVAKSPKDGYTLMFATSATHGIAKFMYKDLPYDPIADFAPVGLIGNVTVGVFAGQKSGIETMDQLLAQARANPGKVNYGSNGVGSVAHLAGELLQVRAKVKLTHVPYASTVPQMTDLIGGQTQIVFSGFGSGITYTKDGRARLIAVAAKTRIKSHPNIPTVAELVPGFEAPAWLAFVAPAGTPREALDKLEDAFQFALNDKDVRDVLDAQGVEVDAMNARAFGDKMRREMQLWEEAVKAAGVQPAALR